MWPALSLGTNSCGGTALCRDQHLWCCSHSGEQSDRILWLLCFPFFPTSCGCVRQQQPEEPRLLPVPPLSDLLTAFPRASANAAAVTLGTRLGSPSPDKPTNSGSGPAPVANLVLTDDFVKQGRDTRRKIFWKSSALSPFLSSFQSREGITCVSPPSPALL